jgi:hypothetical protein
MGMNFDTCISWILNILDVSLSFLFACTLMGHPWLMWERFDLNSTNIHCHYYKLRVSMKYMCQSSSPLWKRLVRKGVYKILVEKTPEWCHCQDYFKKTQVPICLFEVSICLIGVPNCPGADLSWYRNVSHRFEVTLSRLVNLGKFCMVMWLSYTFFFRFSSCIE